ncbi:hypothetical protein HDV00_001085, partial [Rhizophlyctis rosea]
MEGRRIVFVRTDPNTTYINGANQVAVKYSPERGLIAGPAGMDVRVDPSGAVKVDPGLGLDVRTDDVSIKKTAGTLTVNLSETDIGLQQLADGLGIRTQELDPIKSGFDGLYLQLSPDDSCLSKTSSGLEVSVAPDGPLRKEVLGLDVAVDGLTIKKSLVGLEGGYVGESPDITVTENMIICNITAGSGLRKLGSVISLLPDVEDKLDQIPDDIGEKLTDLHNLKNTLGDLSSVVDNIGDIGKQIGISIGTSALTSAITSAVSAAAMGLAAQSAAQNLISANAAKIIGVGGLFSGLFGLARGLLGSSLCKKGSSNTYIS